MKKVFVKGGSFELFVYCDVYFNVYVVNLMKFVVELKMDFWLFLFFFFSNVKKLFILKIVVFFLVFNCIL